MRSSSLLSVVALVAGLATGACRDSHTSAPDGGGVDDATPEDGIAAARAAADGTTLALAIRGATITYLKPQVGSASSDPAGFTIQAARPGPALFVAVDPATLTPPAAVGDVVDFTITGKRTVAAQPRAVAIAGYTRTATGADVAALAQDVSTAGDLVTAIDSYESELVALTATVSGELSAGGTGFVRAAISSAGVTGEANFQIRAPDALVDAIDLVRTCQITVARVPMGRFNAQAQLAVFASDDVVLRGCPAPVITSATATSPTTLSLTFSRHLLASSVLANGSQFVLDHGVTASAAVVNGRTITLTTTAQAAATPYTLTIAKTVTDRQGVALAGTGIALFAGFGTGTGTGSGALLSVHTTLGIPSLSSSDDPNSFLSSKSGYVLSYNGSRKVPNWVSWELNTSYLGQADRQNNYRPDDTFPGGQPQASLADYSGSGYDRGHMCPSADRTKTDADNSLTFYLTNMIPQAANNNRGPWEKLESASRVIAQTGKELFIITGGTFSASSNTIGNGLVVPDQTFKVIVVLDAVGQGPASVTAATRVIAVLMPNEDALISLAADWRPYRVSVDAIEALTGYDLLSDVDPAVQAVVEARVDNL